MLLEESHNLDAMLLKACRNRDLNPRSSTANENLGLAYYEIASTIVSQYYDSEPDYYAALAYFEQAIKLNVNSGCD